MAKQRHHVEVEHKLDAAESLGLPDLTGVKGVAAVGDPEAHELSATYHDTADLQLLRHRITLRRRTGGHDAGWHLKLPGGLGPGGARLEIRRPLGRSAATVPAPLADLVAGFTRGRQLRPVARLTTQRTVRHLRDGDGRDLVEVADDTVTAEVLPAGPEDSLEISSWRELEVELAEDAGPAGEKVLAATAAALRDAGATDASVASKVGRALEGRLARVTEEDAARAAARSGGEGGTPVRIRAKSAGAAVHAYLSAQVTALQWADPHVRAGTEDAVHQLRVAARRLRSGLATFRPFLDREVTDPLRDELRWVGNVLGAARDAEVMHVRLRAALGELPGDLVLGPVARRIDLEQRAALRQATERALEELRGPRYAALLDALDALVATPPWTDAAAERARPALRARVAGTARRLQRVHAAVEAAAPGEQHDTALHELRKAAKRARYAGEATVDVFGEPARRYAKAAERLQEALGVHQDGVVTRERLRELGVQAFLAGENGFTFGVLYGEEVARAADVDADLPPLWKAFRSQVKAWPGKG